MMDSTSPVDSFITKARAEDVLRRNNAFEGGLDNLLRRRRDDVERKLVAFGEIIERAGEERDIVLQADALASSTRCSRRTRRNSGSWRMR